MNETTTTRETVAVVATDGTGIDLLHADVERDTETGHEVHVEPAEQEWIETPNGLHYETALADAGWSSGNWHATAHEGGWQEARVERTA